jgi:hypothetical protein
MSKKIETIGTCQNCGDRYGITLYRSIWGEVPENRSMVMDDEINTTTCPNCGLHAKISYPFLYTHKNPNFAVWWEPYHDQSIDDDQIKWAHLPGIPDYLVSPPRIRDWEDFKSAIRKMESMPINQQDTGSKKDEDLSHINIKTKSSDPRDDNSGCLGIFFLTIVAALSYFLIT